MIYFRNVISNRIERVISVEYAFQKIDDLPEGFLCPKRERSNGEEDRLNLHIKIKNMINEPFAVINAVTRGIFD